MNLDARIWQTRLVAYRFFSHPHWNKGFGWFTQNWIFMFCKSFSQAKDQPYWLRPALPFENINLFSLMSSYLFFLTFVYFCCIIPFIHVCVIFPSSLNPFSLWWIYSHFAWRDMDFKTKSHWSLTLTQFLCCCGSSLSGWKRRSAAKEDDHWTISGNHKQKTYN